MRLKAFAAAFTALLALAFARPSQAQLPDLRGETFIMTGNLLVTGIAFGQDFSQVANGGIDFVKGNFARLIIDSSGPVNNSALTGKFRLPVFPSTGNPTVPNPEIPITGSFDRTTGNFAFSGTLPSITIIDFGVTNLGPPLNNKRIQVRLQSLSVSFAGTGAITGGQFKITQTGTAPFVFPISDPPNTGVLLCLQDPSQTSFGGLIDNVVNSSITLRNGSAFQPAIRGTLAVEGIANLGATVKPVGPVRFRFVGVNGVQNKEVLLNNDGTYVCYVSPDIYATVKAKGATTLTKTLTTALNLERDDVSNINGTLLSGDSNDDNTVDITDLLLVIGVYNKVAPDPMYNVLCDYNRDGANDITDLLLLIGNYNKLGD